jgi:hypothetical protein
MRRLFRRMISAAVVATALTVVPATPAGAATVVDPNDTRGRLDITFVSLQNDEQNALVRFRLDTQWGYGCRFLARTSPNRVYVWFDVRSNNDVDSIARLMCGGGGWFLKMGDGSRFFGTHPDRDTTIVNIGWEGLPGDQSVTHGSAVVTTRDASSGPCTNTSCRDRAPNAGSLAAW